MKISEMIENLEKIKQEIGDVNVLVEYADAGGQYNGQAEAEMYSTSEHVFIWHGKEFIIK